MRFGGYYRDYNASLFLLVSPMFLRVLKHVWMNRFLSWGEIVDEVVTKNVVYTNKVGIPMLVKVCQSGYKMRRPRGSLIKLLVRG